MSVHSYPVIQRLMCDDKINSQTHRPKGLSHNLGSLFDLKLVKTKQFEYAIQHIDNCQPELKQICIFTTNQ